MAGRSHHLPWRPPPRTDLAPGGRLRLGPCSGQQPLPADAGAHVAGLREHHPHPWAGPQDAYPYGVHLSSNEGVPSCPRPAQGGPGADILGAQVPLAEIVRRHSLPEVDPDLRANEGVTTMAILNIPYAYPKWMLQWDINQEGFAYGYFHFPRETRTGRSRGFAFVDFLTTGAANAFQRSFNNRVLYDPGGQARVVTVVASERQGLEQNARLHPESQVANPQAQLQRHQQRHQQQLRQQQQAAAPAAVGQSASSSSSRAAPLPLHPLSPSGSVSAIYRFSF